MDRRIGSKWKNKRNLIKLLQCRENNAEAGRILKERAQFTDSLVKRLGLEAELEGHHGCVNCLQWTHDGKHLASGSDDTNVILWDPFRRKQLQLIPTDHIGNIFSVKFLGTNSNIIVTAAGDCRVLVQTIEGVTAKTAPILECSCHVNRVKRLATSPDEPTLFWSAGEDGNVLQYDLREPHECSTGKNVLICLPTKSEVKCVAVNPTKPHYVAVGANDCFVRMYDRRKMEPCKIADSTARGDQGEPNDPNCVQYYSPGHLAMENSLTPNFKLAATYVAFNAAGSEMLVNMGGEQIYLFDVNNARTINELKAPPITANRISKIKHNCCKNLEGNGFVNNYNLDSITNTQQECACYYIQRATRCFNRKWMGDLYSAARDYLYVIKHWPQEHKKAYIGLIKCLIALKWIDEAKHWLEYVRTLNDMFADSTQIKCLVDKIEELKKSPRNSSKSNKECTEKLDEQETNLRLDSIDYEIRFLGHCNTTTDIKEANFLGEDGNYVCAGSDEGVIFIWERKYSSIVTAFLGDVSIVNCIQPHPSACFIASSGIDSSVKLWSPIKEDDGTNVRLVTDITAVVEANQQRMSLDPFESMLVNMGYYGGGFQEIPQCRTC